MNIEDLKAKIEALPDEHSVMTYSQKAGSNAAAFKTDDLKALVARLREAERFNALVDLIDVDEDGIFNVHRNGKLIGYGPTVKDAIHSAIGFELHLSENKNGNS